MLVQNHTVTQSYSHRFLSQLILAIMPSIWMHVTDWLPQGDVKTVVIHNGACPVGVVTMEVHDSDTGKKVWSWERHGSDAPSRTPDQDLAGSLYPARWTVTVKFAVERFSPYLTDTPRSGLKYGVLNAHGQQLFPWPTEAGEVQEDPCRYAQVIGFVVACDRDADTAQLRPLPSSLSDAQRQANAVAAEGYHEMVRNFCAQSSAAKEIDTVTHVQLHDSIPTPIRDDAPVVE